MSNNLFLKLLETGNIKFDEDRLMILNAFQIIFPVSIFLKLRELLLKEVGIERGKKILRDLGEHQVQQGMKRYKKLLKIEKLSKEKMMEFLTQHTSLLGWGKFNIIKFEESPTHITFINSNNPIAVEYKILYGISKQPIDDYFSGVLQRAYSVILNKKLECKETFCIAKGDKVCQFEITEKKP